MTRPADRRAALHALLGLGLGLAAPRPASAQEEPSRLARVRQAALLKVGVYKDFAPYSDGKRGIEPDLAEALAARLGVKAQLLPFDAGEDMADDLRNMVWRGHYLGYGPADVLLHVPVERPLIAASPQVLIFAPYQREQVALGRDRRKAASPDALRGLPVGVIAGTIGAIALMAAEGGAWRGDARVFKQWEAAADALRSGQVAGLLATRAQLESVFGRDEAIAIEHWALPLLPPRGWAVGMAVRRDARDLADALEAALRELQRDGTLAALFAQHGVGHVAP